jgi:phosphoglycolate phosphatase
VTGARPDLLICDLDGTLVDSVPGITRTTKAVLLAAGHPVPSDAAVQELIGLPLVQVFQELVPPHIESAEIDVLVATYRDIYARLIIPATRAFPGVIDALQRFRAQGGRVAVATSKLERIAREAIAASGFTDQVDFLVGHDSVTNPKPAPEMVLRCLELASVEPDRALVVGDTDYDVQMARRAGVAACGVTSGVHSRHQLEAAGAQRVVDRFEDVLSIE